MPIKYRKTMKKGLLFIFIVYIFIIISGSVWGIGESTLVLGGQSTWRMAEYRNNVTEAEYIRPNPVLVLSSAEGLLTTGYSAASGVLGNLTALSESALEISISFDEREKGLYRDSLGRYLLSVSPEVEAVDHRYARAGAGAVLFDGTGGVAVKPVNARALFSSGKPVGDFTIEFWLYPMNMENGERIFSWVCSKPLNVQNFTAQKIQCAVSKNRLSWSFVNFFTSVKNNSSAVNIEFSGNTPVVPKTWSHHLIRFDAAGGMVEYLVNGVSEAVVYATSTGRESSEVYIPITGDNGVFTLGESFTGLMDEFKIHSAFAGRSSVRKYSCGGGRVETCAIDLGGNNSSIVRVDASGGRIRTGASAETGAGYNEFRENGRFNFSDDSEMGFLIRSAGNPYLLNNSPWISFTPGLNISGINGRYVQIAVDFYPSSDGESSPYLNELRIVYLPKEPPLPPGNLNVTAVDGGVLLRWKHSPNADTRGYLVYYSDVRGELFGRGAVQGASPIDAGYRNSIFIDGLKNGVLYYFRITSYDYVLGMEKHNEGEFSSEVTARPLAGLSLSDISQGLEVLPVKR